MDRRTLLRAAAAGLLVPASYAAAAGCGVTRDTAAGASGPLGRLRMIVGNSPGSGFDITARTAGKALTAAEAARGVEVVNISGAGGTIGLSRLVNSRGSSETLMMMGLGVVGAVFTNKSRVGLQDTTPLARLIEDPSAIVVPKDSELRSLDDFLDAWRSDPDGLSVGGGSSPGGPDHLLPMQVAEAAGIDPTKTRYIGYDGGGELLTALLGNKIDVAATGIGEMVDQITTGDVRILATTGRTTVEGVHAPTLAQEGIEVSAVNWRGVVAAPGISPSRRDRLVDALRTMRDSGEWKDGVRRNGWTDAFQEGERFKDFLADQNTRVAKTLRRLGLTP
ncbi:Bug family tripartite tricarboxylate transporter substrate binding protein [Streptomyces sp. NPDC048639]|uniref:Bug family tripartite tricarboxylate transporter substrate binding protein n=1 Tax=Streptomyces sp. NPDC048639 TaxID=3365581 RepID=UPI00372304F9